MSETGETEFEGEAPENWEENLRQLADAFKDAEILSAKDMLTRVNYIP